MNRPKHFYAFATVLIMALFGLYACKSDSSSTKDASVFSLPDFKTTTHIQPSSKQQVGSLQDLNHALENIAKQTNPTVVTIKIKQTVKVHNQPFNNPFFRFFGNPNQNPNGGEELRRGLGSGVIVSKDGYILTNNHVVQNADHITVTLSNNKNYTGKVVGTDPLTDLAVVKIDDHNLPAIKMGSSDSLKVGALVMAIGSPEKLSHTVTLGIVSAKHRHIRLIKSHGQYGYENYIQTDAAINPGNSGGALVNMDGELVGINAAIYSKTGMNGGIGFAVPVDLAKEIMKQIIKTGKATHARIGILGKDITSALAQSFGLKNNKGIIVEDVQNNSPAEHAGLKQGDILKTMDGQPIKSYDDFRFKIANSKPGNKITLGIIRNGKRKKVHLTLGKLQLKSNQSSQNNQNVQERLNFQVQELSGRIRQQLNIKSGVQGVIVTDVKRGSKAMQNGLRKGDVITHVNKQKIKDMDDFKKAINKLNNKKHPNILLQVVNPQGMNQYIAFTL